MNEHSIFLKPGDYYYGAGPKQITTILGSCVSIVLWHPRMHVLLVSHCLLPSRAHQIKKHDAKSLDAKYVDEFVQIACNKLMQQGLPLSAFNASLFGAGEMFINVDHVWSVGRRNCEQAQSSLHQQGLSISHSETGGFAYRHLTIDGETGEFTLKTNASGQSSLQSQLRKAYAKTYQAGYCG